MSEKILAALFVEEQGPYSEVNYLDLWGISRDARKYNGPYPVIAHPPCQRWGRYATGGPNPRARRFEIGDDAGCFAAALQAVRKFGGVLEHPEATRAYARFGLNKPPRNGGWIKADEYGYSCCVYQGNYGHPAKKATWLYTVNTDLPRLIWGVSAGKKIDEGFHTKESAKLERETKKTRFTSNSKTLL